MTPKQRLPLSLSFPVAHHPPPPSVRGPNPARLRAASIQSAPHPAALSLSHRCIRASMMVKVLRAVRSSSGKDALIFPFYRLHLKSVVLANLRKFAQPVNLRSRRMFG